MPGPDGLLVLALDFDGALVEGGSPIAWRRGAREFVIAAAASGVGIWVHSCRATPPGRDLLPGDEEELARSGRVPAAIEAAWALREEMIAFLEGEGVLGLVEVWDRPGKPLADAYVDDRGEAPDWVVLAGELGVRLEHGRRGGPEAMGAAPGGTATGSLPGAVARPAGLGGPSSAAGAAGLRLVVRPGDGTLSAGAGAGGPSSAPADGL